MHCRHYCPLLLMLARSHDYCLLWGDAAVVYVH
jgi:hypothetical protein